MTSQDEIEEDLVEEVPDTDALSPPPKSNVTSTSPHAEHQRNFAAHFQAQRTRSFELLNEARAPLASADPIGGSAGDDEQSILTQPDILKSSQDNQKAIERVAPASEQNGHRLATSLQGVFDAQFCGGVSREGHVAINNAEDETLPASLGADDVEVKSHVDGTIDGGLTQDPVAAVPMAEQRIDATPPRDRLVEDAPLTKQWLELAKLTSELDRNELEADEDEHIPEQVRPDQVPDEPWMNGPDTELWDRVRPFALRREAHQVKELKLPATSMSRIVKMHPNLYMKSAEAVELINVSTVLMLQQIVKKVAREKSAAVVQFDDVRQACSGVRELQFLHPLSSTLDASAHTFCSGGSVDHNDRDVSKHEAKSSKTASKKDGGYPGEGQKQLSAAAFAAMARSSVAPAEQDARHTDADLETAAATGRADSTPKKNNGRGAKRKAPASTQKASSAKAKRAEAHTGPGLKSFFKSSGDSDVTPLEPISEVEAQLAQ